MDDADAAEEPLARFAVDAYRLANHFGGDYSIGAIAGMDCDMVQYMLKAINMGKAKKASNHRKANWYNEMGITPASGATYT